MHAPAAITLQRQRSQPPRLVGNLLIPSTTGCYHYHWVIVVQRHMYEVPTVAQRPPSSNSISYIFPFLAPGQAFLFFVSRFPAPASLSGGRSPPPVPRNQKHRGTTEHLPVKAAAYPFSLQRRGSTCEPASLSSPETGALRSSLY